MPWHKNWLVNIEYDRVDLVKEGANSPAFIKLIKSRGGSSMTLEEILKAMKPEHAAIVTKALEDKDAALQSAIEEAVAKAKGEMAAAQPPAPGTSEEDILKSVKDPAVKALLETQIAKAKAAEAELKKARDMQEQAEAVSKAKEVPNIGAEEAKLAEIYKKLKATDAQLCEDVFGILKSASALISEGGAFTEIGKSAPAGGSGSADESTAWAQIEKAADAIAKERNISKAASISAAIKENPELYEQYLRTQV